MSFLLFLLLLSRGVIFKISQKFVVQGIGIWDGGDQGKKKKKLGGNFYSKKWHTQVDEGISRCIIKLQSF